MVPKHWTKKRKVLAILNAGYSEEERTLERYEHFIKVYQHSTLDLMMKDLNIEEPIVAQMDLTMEMELLK